MENLEKKLPQIVQEALKKEDRVTRILASTLLQHLYSRPNTEKLNQVITTALDTEIDKCIAAGFITETDNYGEY